MSSTSLTWRRPPQIVRRPFKSPLCFAGRGKGKSGGYRVITFYAGPKIPAFLLALYAKGERADLSKAERNELRPLLGAIVETYRTGVVRRA